MKIFLPALVIFLILVAVLIWTIVPAEKDSNEKIIENPYLNYLDPDMNTNNDFNTRYPNPIINNRQATKISGLEIINVFDKSQEAEDPINTTDWIVNSKGEKFYLDTKGVENAIKSVNFIPKTQEEIIEVATMQYEYDSDYVVVAESGKRYFTEPDSAVSQVQAPIVEEIQNGYKITFFTTYINHIAKWYNEDIKNIEKHQVILVKDSLAEETTTIWTNDESKIRRTMNLRLDK